MWVKLCSQVQGLLPGCTALPANGFSISPKPFWIDDYIGWNQVCISISHLDIGLFKSLASKDWRFHFSPLCGCYYTLPGANASGSLVCVEDSDDGWCLTHQPWFMGSWTVGRKLQNGATTWQSGWGTTMGRFPHSDFWGRKGAPGNPGGQRQLNCNQQINVAQGDSVRSSCASRFPLKKLSGRDQNWASVGLEGWTTHIMHSGLHFSSRCCREVELERMVMSQVAGRYLAWAAKWGSSALCRKELKTEPW